MVDVPGSEFRKYWAQKLAYLKSVCHVITNKQPEAASIMEHVPRIYNIGNLTGCTPVKVGKILSGHLL
jgi:hypothetical protein